MLFFVEQSKDSFLIGANKWSLVISSLQTLRYSNRRHHSPELDLLSDFSGPFTAGTSFYCFKSWFYRIGSKRTLSQDRLFGRWFVAISSFATFTDSAPDYSPKWSVLEWSSWAHGWEICQFFFLNYLLVLLFWIIEEN